MAPAQAPNRMRLKSRMTRRELLALAAGGVVAQRGRAATDVFSVTIGSSSIEVTLPNGGVDLAPPALMGWVSIAARAVAAYYGTFPTPQASVNVRAVENRAGVLHGTTYGGDPPRTVMGVGQHTTARQLDDDWTMTHEFVHLAFPGMRRQHHWLEEGQATYIEPIARAQIGRLSEERVWGDMVRDMHQGLPGPNDRGLDNTHTWGRTYWGGAIFCLLADVTIRERTGNRAGLQQALRGVLSAGGNIEYDWPIEDALQAGDNAVKVGVLQEIYSEMKDKPYAPDLVALWRRLGVESTASGIRFRDDAPLSGIRKAITQPFV